jgi:hypothetical protein
MQIKLSSELFFARVSKGDQQPRSALPRGAWVTTNQGDCENNSKPQSMLR